MSNPGLPLSIDELLKRSGYTSEPASQPYHGKRVFRDGVLVGIFHVGTIWSLPGLLNTLDEIDPIEAAAVRASIAERNGVVS